MKNLHVRKIASAVLVASLLLAGCSGKEEREAKYLQNAQEYFDQENIDKTKIEVKNVLQINPNNAKARYLLALIDEKEQNWRGMFSNLSVAIEADPNLLEARYKLGLLYIASGELVEAKKQADAIQKAKPEQAEYYALLAVVAQRQKNPAEAEAMARKALAIDPANIAAVGIYADVVSETNANDALSVVSQALAKSDKDTTLKMLRIRLLEGQGKTEEVISTFKEMIAAKPDQTTAVFQLAQYLASKKRYDDFDVFVKQAIVDYPEEANLKILYVDFLEQVRGGINAEQVLLDYIKASPDQFKLRDTLAARYLRNKQNDKAKALFDDVIASDPKGSQAIEARVRLIAIASLEKDQPKVESLVAEVLEIEPENADVLLTRSQISRSKGDIESAIADLRVARKSKPDSLAIVVSLASAQEAAGINELALENYRAALAIKNDNYDALVGVGRILYGQSDFEKAYDSLLAANKINPVDPQVIGYLGDIYVRRNQWDEALALVNPLLLKTETAALGFYFKGKLLSAKKDYSGAEEALRQSLAKSPSPDALRDLVTLLAAQNKLADATALVDDFIKNNPKALYATELRANIYLISGNPEKAQELFASLLEKNPDNAGLYRKQIQAYSALKKTPDEIMAFLDSGIGKAKNKDELLVLKAELLQAQNKPLEAVAIYEQLLAKNPKSQLLQNNIAALIMDYAPTPENLEKVKKLTADLAASENPALLDTVGWLQYKLGNYPQALSLLQDARKKGSAGAVYDYHLGMAYYQAGNKAKAKELLEAATANEKENYVGKDEALKTLKELSAQ